MLQSIDDVVEDRNREEIGLVADIGDVAPGRAFRQGGHVGASPAQRAAAGQYQPRQDEAERFLAGAVESHDRQMIARTDLQRGIVEQACSAFLVISDRLGGEAAFRECAAYVLDHEHFSGVPATDLVACSYPGFNSPTTGTSLSDENIKIGSFQEFKGEFFLPYK